jgi:hypothetical protein
MIDLIDILTFPHISALAFSINKIQHVKDLIKRVKYLVDI